jgi:hypothetical protein
LLFCFPFSAVRPKPLKDRSVRKFVLLILLAAFAAAFAPVSAEAHPGVACKRVWYRGHLVRRCRQQPLPRHHHHRPPPHRRGNYV